MKRPVVLFLSACIAAACASAESDAVLDASTPSDANPRDAEPARDSSPPIEVIDAAASDAARDVSVDVATESAKPFVCAADSTFPFALNVAEASGSAEVELTAGVREMLIASDSGHAGAALLVGIPGGQKRAITLALDAAASDDIEGVAWHAGHVYTLTSSGAFRRYSPDGAGGLTRDIDATAIGASPYACSDLKAFNCGKNYEGLCLRSAAAVASGSHRCAGYAASKAEGALYCLVIDAQGHLVASTTVPPISLALAADLLSDCAFGTAGGPAENVLVVATNVGGGSLTYRVDEATGARVKLTIATLPNEESVAIDKDGSLYVFDDNSSSLSAAAKSKCTGW